MGGRLPAVTGADVVRALQRGGWAILRQTGSHVHLRHPDRGGLVTVPAHSGRTLGRGLLSDILARAGLSQAEFRRLL